MTKKVIVMTVALLTLAACSNQRETAMLSPKTQWDVIAASSTPAKPTKNSFLIMMR